MKIQIFVILVFVVNSALAGISSSTGFQRKNQGDSWTVQWTVTGTVNDFVVYNPTTGAPVVQSSRLSLKMNNVSNTISLSITSVVPNDAGSYTLSINNGATWVNDSSALLFVFGYGSISWSPTLLVRTPPLEGDSLELTCNLTSNSQPAANRTSQLYSWYLPRFSNTLQVLPNGSLQLPNGTIVTGCGTKNSGRTLTIASAQYNDGSFTCYVKEEGASFTIQASYYFNIQYKPYVASTLPITRKFNAAVGEIVQLSFQYRANPSVQPTESNWTFVNTQGINQDLPDGSAIGTYSSPSLAFTLSTANLYGKYSYNISNAIGTTMVTFEVLQPGKPDAPAAFQVAYASHFTIGLQWNCMWSNFNSRVQYVYTQLRESASNILIGNISYQLSGTCYDSVYTTIFSSKIQPDTSYEAIVWSANEIGSSDTKKIRLRSGKVFRFIVTSESILLNGTTAIINYRMESGNITRFQVTCCYELTGVCYTPGIFYVNDIVGQAFVPMASLPNGTEYVFDFVLYVGNVYPSIAGSLKGVRVSTTTGPRQTIPPGANGSDLTSTVIALAIVLGIAMLAIIGMLIGFFVWRRRHHSPTKSNSQELQGRNKSDAEDYYQTMDRQTSENRVYTNLDLTKRD